MITYEEYFVNLIKEATKTLNLDLQKIDSQSGFITFTINDVNMFAPVIRLAGGARFRVFYDVLNISFEPNDYDLIFQVNKLIHHFNLFEGGLTQLILVEDELGRETPVFKAIDICLSDDAVNNEYINEYHLNLVADVISVASRMEYYRVNYLNKLESLGYTGKN